ncbi:MAG: hypothetical protein K5668_03490 [Lachnospiraceae bacterium]|nr:hypothetical protein [Lachnospiraceae bacterium]
MKDKVKIYKFISLGLSLCLLLSGCGGGFVDLTEDESKQIVNYSTNVLSDHNSAVKGSLKTLTKTDLKDIVIKDDPGIIDEIEAAKEEATKAFEEAVTPEETSKDGRSGSEGESSDDENAPLEIQNADIASLIGLSGFRVDYSGHAVQDSYPAPGDPEADMIFSIEPATANDKLLVFYFNVTNTGMEEADCNILDLRPRFRFKSGGKTHSFLTTLLLDDLSTLEVMLQPGESKRAVLVAEISEEKANELSDLTLIIMGEDENTEILLEKSVEGAPEDTETQESGEGEPAGDAEPEGEVSAE